MANWGDPWGSAWDLSGAGQGSETQAAPWGSAWGVPWSGRAAVEQSVPGGGNGGSVQPLPGKRRKRHVNPDDEINKLVAEAMEGESSPAVAPNLNQPTPEDILSSRPINANTKTTAAIELFTSLDSDDDEALLLLLVA